jgi:hypothetical protein
MQALSGRPIYSNFLFPRKDQDSSEHPHGPLASDDELWADMEQGLHETVPETARIRLRNADHHDHDAEAAAGLK